MKEASGLLNSICTCCGTHTNTHVRLKEKQGVLAENAHGSRLQPQYYINWAWMGIPLVLALRQWRQGNQVQRHPQLHTEFKPSLGYMRPCLKMKQKQSNDSK